MRHAIRAYQFEISAVCGVNLYFQNLIPRPSWGLFSYFRGLKVSDRWPAALGRSGLVLPYFTDIHVDLSQGIGRIVQVEYIRLLPKTYNLSV